MKIPFSKLPGRHERHFQRKLDNTLFPRPIINPKDEDLLQVQRDDHEELIDHVNRLRETVNQAVSLKDNEESQVILDLKGQLDRLYEEACTLADQQDNNKAAIKQLIGVIMATVRQGAMGDPMAMQELEDEDAARAAHFQLLENPLVADLLHTETLIEADELLPTLLSEGEDSLTEVLAMFEDAQLMQISKDGTTLLASLELEDAVREQAQQRLTTIDHFLSSQSRVN
ncbi:MAG: hypothetical protein ACWA5Q_08495 [bacterium]